MRLSILLLFPCTVVLTGCVPFDVAAPSQTPAAPAPQSTTALVPVSPFGDTAPAAPLTRVAFTPVSNDASSRVESVGRKLVAANPQLGVRPAFITAGAADIAIGHEATGRVIISESVVRQCSSDAQLAALLALELGKMVGERDAGGHEKADLSGRLPPIELPIGNSSSDVVNQGGFMRQAEMARYARDRSAAAAPADPQKIARTCLTKAGFAATDLDATLPLVQPAEQKAAPQQQAPQQAPPPPPQVLNPQWR